MSEAEVVRLVRCPKCENLLSELAGYSVYQCGGCGAVLRAKVKEREAESAEKSDDKNLGVFDRTGDQSQNGAKESDVSIMDTESKFSASKENNGAKIDKYLQPQCVPDDNSIAKIDLYASEGRGKSRNDEKPLNHAGNVSRSQGLDHSPHQRGEVSGQCENARGETEGKRPMNLNYRQEGPSNYSSDLIYDDKAEPGKNFDGLNMPKNIGSLQKDRAELLQMMDALRDQLSRSVNLGADMKEKSHNDHNVAHQGSNRSSTSGMFKNNSPSPSVGMRPGFLPENPTISPYYDHHHLPHYSDASRQRIGVPNPHPCPYSHSDMPGYVNFFEKKMMRGPFPTPSHYDHQILHPTYYPGQPYTLNPILNAPNSANGLLKQPVCGCYNCCSDHHRAIQPDYPDDTIFYDIHNDPVLCHRSIPGSSAQRGYNRRTSGASTTIHGPSAHTKLADDDMTCYTRGFERRNQQKEVVSMGGRHCQPIASGAPFIKCPSCSKLLQLPKMTFKLNSKRQKVYCGACNTVMDCAFINKKFTISVPGGLKNIVKEVGPHVADIRNEGISSELSWGKMNSVSDDFDSSSNEFQAANGKPPVLTRELDLTSYETQDSQSLPPSSPASFEGVESSEDLASPSSRRLPSQDQLGNSFNANVTSRVWKGSHSTRSDHEKVMPKDMISRQNSLNETSAKTEEVSFNVYSKTRVSQKLEPASQRTDPVRTNKGSNFAVVIKKSLKGLSRSNHSANNRDGNVTINGCKIPDRLVKKAEKLAGPVQPGNYWYDFQAGFWGVIGGPCLGIIPPFVEEFNYPMQANCSSGTTRVFVNGRELQQIDLDLLASRGLPNTRGRSYAIEISGKVVDKDSGEELDGLGKLAPTIEKVKHGFGMKPRTQLVQ